jgi:ADP-heptose:LPS heptosyltransferase
MTIVVAPFSNSDIRDWPAEHYAALIGHLAAAWPGRIRVIGTANQRLRARDIVRAQDPDRVSNDCGRIAWAQVVEELRVASCVIGNNSGVAHLAGRFGVPTLCVFGGSHQRLEWRPLGTGVVTLTRSIGCSPCHFDHGFSCPFDKACLRLITPRLVADTALALMAERVPDIAADDHDMVPAQQEHA